MKKKSKLSNSISPDRTKTLQQYQKNIKTEFRRNINGEHSVKQCFEHSLTKIIYRTLKIADRSV